MPWSAAAGEKVEAQVSNGLRKSDGEILDFYNQPSRIRKQNTDFLHSPVVTKNHHRAFVVSGPPRRRIHWSLLNYPDSAIKADKDILKVKGDISVKDCFNFQMLMKPAALPELSAASLKSTECYANWACFLKFFALKNETVIYKFANLLYSGKIFAGNRWISLN